MVAGYLEIFMFGGGVLGVVRSQVTEVQHVNKEDHRRWCVSESWTYKEEKDDLSSQTIQSALFVSNLV